MAHSAIMSVRITGNADDAVKAFEKTTTKAAAFGSAIGGLAVKGVTALWDTVKGFASDVVNMSDSTDKFMNTMSFAGIDTKAVQAAAKETRKYADDTVYGLDDIQNTTAQLAANGIGNYMELTEAAGNLNAVAGGNVDTFKSVAMMLTQTAGAGKLTTENWNQLTDAIPGASGKLQEALLKNGAYTGNFRDAMAKGEITADEFNQALLDLGMTDVAKQAATSTSTIEGAMGNLEAAVVGGLTDAFNLFKPAVTGGINAASTAVTSLATTGVQGLQTFFGQVKDTGAFTALQSAAQSVGGGLQSLWNGIMAVVNAMTGGQPAGTAFGNVLNTVATAAQTVGGWLKTAGDWISRNTDLVTPLVAAIGGAVAAVTAVTTAMRIAAVAQALLNAVMGEKVAITSRTAPRTRSCWSSRSSPRSWPDSPTSSPAPTPARPCGRASRVSSPAVCRASSASSPVSAPPSSASSARPRTVPGTRGTAWSAGSVDCRAPSPGSSATPAASCTTPAQASSAVSSTA